jgi:Cys-tRNA(Pro)/Cys-tRNA(Cys) deacylase
VSEQTPAMRALEGSALRFDVVRTRRANSAQESAALQGIDVARLLRTIVVRRGTDDYVFVLVPGGRQIDWPKLRAHLGVSRISLPDAEEARAATGYERGAITPFGSTAPWPVVADATVPQQERVAIGGGAHGVNLHVRARDLLDELRADVADVTRPAEDRATERSQDSTKGTAEETAEENGGTP